MENRVTQVDDYVKINNILVSVADKSGLDTLLPALVRINPQVRFFSTGGTYQFIRDLLGEKSKEHLLAVSEYTGQPEMQGGLVKTLDFKIYLGLLSETYNEAHQADLKRTGAVEIDMVIANLYPFGKVTQNPSCGLEEARAHIDIGGPCMIRAAAKNFLRVASVCRPEEYPKIIAGLTAHEGALSLAERYALAAGAFRHTADYDKAIAGFFETRLDRDPGEEYQRK